MVEGSKEKIEEELNPEVNPEDIITIAIDSTGIKVTNRGESIQHNKWNTRKRRGFIKIHLAVDIRTKRSLDESNKGRCF